MSKLSGSDMSRFEEEQSALSHSSGNEKMKKMLMGIDFLNKRLQLINEKEVHKKNKTLKSKNKYL